MQLDLFLSNLLNPPVLFFFLGMAAVLCRSDLEIPNAITKALSLYLLFAIGFKGGHALNQSGLSVEVIVTLLTAIVLSAIVPFYAYWLLRRRLGVADAAAIAATYGSISAVTFITASAYLDKVGVDYSGYLVAAMALMESPAIIIGVMLYRRYRDSTGDEVNVSDWGELFRDAFFNGSVFLILGSMVIGALTGDKGMTALKPFTVELFTGVLCLFLLDMGLVAARRLSDLLRGGWFLGGFSILLPLFNALLAVVLAALIGLSEGDALMLMVLAASASYIAVPAAMRLAIPDANPSLYVPMSLAITFPFNITFGIPLYHMLVKTLW